MITPNDNSSYKGKIPDVNKADNMSFFFDNDFSHEKKGQNDNFFQFFNSTNNDLSFITDFEFGGENNNKKFHDFNLTHEIDGGNVSEQNLFQNKEQKDQNFHGNFFTGKSAVVSEADKTDFSFISKKRFPDSVQVENKDEFYRGENDDSFNFFNTTISSIPECMSLESTTKSNSSFRSKLSKAMKGSQKEKRAKLSCKKYNIRDKILNNALNSCLLFCNTLIYKYARKIIGPNIRFYKIDIDIKKNFEIKRNLLNFSVGDILRLKNGKQIGMSVCKLKEINLNDATYNKVTIFPQIREFLDQKFSDFMKNYYMKREEDFPELIQELKINCPLSSKLFFSGLLRKAEEYNKDYVDLLISVVKQEFFIDPNKDSNS